MDDHFFGWNWVVLVPIQVAISVGWFSVHSGMYGVVLLWKTFGIQEWETTIIARASILNFMWGSTEFKWLKRLSTCSFLTMLMTSSTSLFHQGLDMRHRGPSGYFFKVFHVSVGNNWRYRQTHCSSLAFLHTQSTPYGLELSNPETLLFNSLTREIMPVINRIPINTNSDDNHYETLVEIQEKADRTKIIWEIVIPFH